MSEQFPGLAIAVCDYKLSKKDTVTLHDDVAYDPRVKIAALFLFIGLDRVDRHVREEERALQDLMRSKTAKFGFKGLGLTRAYYPDDFERIIQGQRSKAVSKITKKLKERDVYLDLNLSDALAWNEVSGNKLTVHPIEVLGLQRVKKINGDEWQVGGGFFLYRVHRSVSAKTKDLLSEKLQNALAPYTGEVA
ncbi:MAG: hypothetical protein U5L75_01375 [Candidatus Campbellbacteria bacterium]|nr:hypothetical protein [Candidatus Campbellbacteria bacterium]